MVRREDYLSYVFKRKQNNVRKKQSIPLFQHHHLSFPYLLSLPPPHNSPPSLLLSSYNVVGQSGQFLFGLADGLWPGLGLRACKRVSVQACQRATKVWTGISMLLCPIQHHSFFFPPHFSFIIIKEGASFKHTHSGHSASFHPFLSNLVVTASSVGFRVPPTSEFCDTFLSSPTIFQVPFCSFPPGLCGNNTSGSFELCAKALQNPVSSKYSFRLLLPWGCNFIFYLLDAEPQIFPVFFSLIRIRSQPSTCTSWEYLDSTSITPQPDITLFILPIFLFFWS